MIRREMNAGAFVAGHLRAEKYDLVAVAIVNDQTASRHRAALSVVGVIGTLPVPALGAIGCDSE